MTGATLSRFFGLHVAVLPAITTALVARASAARAATGHERSATRGIGQLKPGETRQTDAVLPELRSARRARWYIAVSCAGRARGVLSVGARQEGRSVRRSAGGHQAGVVFPRDVPHAEADSEPRARRRRRAARRARVRRRSPMFLVFVPVSRSAIERWTDDSPIYTSLAIAGLRLPSSCLRSSAQRRQVRADVDALSRLLACHRGRHHAVRQPPRCRSGGGDEHVCVVPRDTVRRAPVTHRPTTFAEARTCIARTASCVRTATAAITTTTDKTKAHDAGARLQRQSRRDRQSSRRVRGATVTPSSCAASRLASASIRPPSTRRASMACGSPLATRVATCVSCHGAHGIRRVNDVKSPVFPTNVANDVHGVPRDTAPHMGGYSLAEQATAANEPALPVPTERALRRADEGQRSFGADLQRLSRQPRRGAARRRFRRQRLRDVPRRLRGKVRHERPRADLRPRMRRVPQQSRHKETVRRDARNRCGQLVRHVPQRRRRQRTGGSRIDARRHRAS